MPNTLVGNIKGPAGLPSHTLSTSSFTVPPVGSTVTVSVEDTSWVALNEILWIENAGGTGIAGSMQVTAITPTSLTLLNIASSTGPQGPVGPPGPAGPPGPPGPSTPSANTGNLLTAGSDSLLYLPSSAIQPVVWSARLRSYNAVGNPTTECDQRQCGNAIAITSADMPLIDRWRGGVSPGIGVTAQQLTGNILVPLTGTSYFITSKFLRFTVTTAKPNLAPTDIVGFWQVIEGSQLRELLGDVHSLSLLVRCSAAATGFGLTIQDSTATWGLTKQCITASSSTAWRLISLANLPIWTPSGSFPTTPGSVGYYIDITLAAGSSQLAPANDIWVNSPNTGSALVQNNFVNSVGTTFDIAFVQHEPGSVCSIPIDKPFPQNLDECKRYYQKTYDDGTVAGTIIQAGSATVYALNNQWLLGVGPLEKAMATTPSVIIWDPYNGAPNSVYGYDGSHCGINMMQGQSTKVPFVIVGNNAGAINTAVIYTLHYTADTGW